VQDILETVLKKPVGDRKKNWLETGKILPVKFISQENG
jgi:hypothetical protein